MDTGIHVARDSGVGSCRLLAEYFIGVAAQRLFDLAEGIADQLVKFRVLIYKDRRFRIAEAIGGNRVSLMILPVIKDALYKVKGVVRAVQVRAADLLYICLLYTSRCV